MTDEEMFESGYDKAKKDCMSAVEMMGFSHFAHPQTLKSNVLFTIENVINTRSRGEEKAAKLTQRERWLMEKAYERARHVVSPYFGDWLEEMAADGVTVEQVLVKEAPPSAG
jgi:hypothetical protein